METGPSFPWSTSSELALFQVPSSFLFLIKNMFGKKWILLIICCLDKKELRQDDKIWFFLSNYYADFGAPQTSRDEQALQHGRRCGIPCQHFRWRQTGGTDKLLFYQVAASTPTSHDVFSHVYLILHNCGDIGNWGRYLGKAAHHVWSCCSWW